MRFSRTSIAVSVAIHLAILAALVAGGITYFKRESLRSGGGGGSGGDVVTVWVEGPRGAIGAGTVATRRSDMKIASEQRRIDERPIGQADGAKSLGTSGGAGGAEDGGTGKAPGTSAGAGTGGDAVLAEIWKKIDRNKFYPTTARMRRLVGVPKVSFEINADGTIKNISLASSCSEKVLDDAAIETVKRAAPLPYYAGPITIGVRFTSD